MLNGVEYMNQRAHNIATDMHFLKQLSSATNQLNNFKSTRLNNVGGLAQLLKIKNARFNFSQQTRENGQEWVRKRGADLKPLIVRIQEAKKQVKIKDEEMKAESQCVFYMSKIGYDNQDEYLEKNFQLGLLKTVQSLMTEEKNRGSYAKRVLNRRNIGRLTKQKSVTEGLPIINLQIRNADKKAEYLKETNQIFKSINSLKGAQWAQKYSNSTKKQFWQIFSNQISALISQKNKSNWISTLALASLSMVESEMKAELPPNYDNILYLLTNQYLGKMRGQYDSDGHLGPVWGICFMLYRAGRREQLYKVVQDQKLRKQFQQADASIQQKRPIKLTGIQESGDLFYNQLIYALRGVSKCSTQALCNPNNLDIVWVFLRNVGIFSSAQDNNIFIGLRRQLYQSYKGPIITDKKIKNLLYLFGYGQIAQIGVNEIMDQDDYLHFLIALYHSLAFQLLSKDKKQFVEKKLTEQLVHYIHELLLQHKNDYLNYMLLIPKPRILEEVSSIIASSHLLQTIDWEYFRNKLDYNLFSKLVHATLQKYVAFHQDFIQVARKQCQLLNDNKAALDFILQLFIRSVLYVKVNPEELKRAEMFASDIISRDYNTRQEYQSVFAFFKENRELLQLIQQRNQYQIYEFIKQCDFILISDQIPNQLRQCFAKLLENKGFQCYIYYLRNLAKAQQIALLRMHKQHQLQELYSLTLNALIGLLRNEPYSEYSNTENVKSFISILQHEYIEEY